MTPGEGTKQQDTWFEYRRLVIAGLRDLKEEIEKVDKDFHIELDKLRKDLQFDIDKIDAKYDKLRDDVITLKVKASILGGVAAAIVSVVINLIVKYLR